MIRGWLRKQFYSAQKKILQKPEVYNFEDELHKFTVRSGKDEGNIVFPKVKNVKDVDVTYPLLPPFAHAHIIWNSSQNRLIYSVIEPTLTEREKSIYLQIEKHIVKSLEIELKKEEMKKDLISYLIEKTKSVVNSHGISLRQGEITKIMYYIYRNFVGLNEIEPLLNDPYLEDIGCDGTKIPLYVIHKKYGSMKTSVLFEDEKLLSNFIVKIAERCNRYVSFAEPILDGILPDGSRVQATYASDITTKGPTFSIRKFRSVPFSVIDLARLGTGSIDMFAYLWYVIEHKKNIFIIGTTAAGKTSFLNSLVSFIPPESKIVSIEDTHEINIMHENWIPAVVRRGFGPSSEKYGAVTMFDLLKAAFRQNPDYVIVGEVRGEEASILFQGMASGLASFGTFHAGSVEEIIDRLETPPINLPPSLINALDVVIVIQHASQIGVDSRRIKSIEEISDIDQKTGSARTVVSFEWSPSADTYTQKNSLLVEQISVEFEVPVKSIVDEIDNRKKFLNWLLKNGISNFEDVSSYLSRYYVDKQNVLEMIARKTYITPKGIFTNKAYEAPKIKELYAPTDRAYSSWINLEEGGGKDKKASASGTPSYFKGVTTISTDKKEVSEVRDKNDGGKKSDSVKSEDNASGKTVDLGYSQDKGKNKGRDLPSS